MTIYTDTYRVGNKTVMKGKYMAQLKVVFVGPPNTGKSSLITALEGKQFELRPHQQTPAPKSTTIKTQAKTKVHQPANHIIWEVPGQTKYQSMVHHYTKDAHIIALVFDLTDPQTLKKLEHYVTNQLNEHPRKNGRLVLVGMKSDTPQSRVTQRISPDTITQFKDRHQISKENYIEISAWTKEGIDKFQKILDDHTLLQLKYRSLVDRKDDFIDKLSLYKIARKEYGVSIFGFSQEEKITAANKTMACFYGADNVIFSKNEEAALKETGSKLIKSIFEALPPDHQNIQLMRSLKETSKIVQSNQSPSYNYNEALIQFLSDYKKMRGLNDKQHYYFFASGFAKNTKLSAADKLIARLKNETSEPFTDTEIRALNNGTLKKTIKTTLSWFSTAPTVEQFIRDNTDGQHATPPRINPT